MSNLSPIRTKIKTFWNHGNFAIIFLYQNTKLLGGHILAAALQLRSIIDATHAGTFGLSTIVETFKAVLLIMVIASIVLGVLALWLVYLGIKVLLVKPALALYTRLKSLSLTFFS
jgi:hypothetical protein